MKLGVPVEPVEGKARHGHDAALRDRLDIAPFRRAPRQLREMRIEREDQRRLGDNDLLQADPLQPDMGGLLALVDILAASKTHRLGMEGVGALVATTVRSLGVIIAYALISRHAGDGRFHPLQRRGNIGS